MVNLVTRLKNVHQTPNFKVVLVLVTVLLVWLELRYNIDLLNNISDPATSTEEANDLANRGKLLAAFGISWVFTRGYLLKAQSFLRGLLLVVACTVAGYFLLDHIYSSVIDRLRPEVKVMGFNLLSYRQDLLSGDLEDPDIPKLADEPVLGRIFMGAFPMVLLDDRFMVPAQDMVTRKADEKHAEVITMSEEKWRDYDDGMKSLHEAHQKFLGASERALGGATSDREWRDYQRKMKDLEEGHEGFVSASRRAVGRANLDREWNNYSGNMSNLRGAHQEFVQGSVKAARHGKGGRDSFVRQSGGMYPDVNISLAQFVVVLKKSSHPRAASLRASEARVIARNADGTVIRGRDLPYFMSRAEFESWNAQRAKSGLRAVGMEPDVNANKEEFLALLRTSTGANGDELRKSEARELGMRKDGSKVLGKDMPYFMDQETFQGWTQELALSSLEAVQMPPNPNASMEEFLDLLRESPGPDGTKFRESESRLIGKRPDGSTLVGKDVPYFMTSAEYRDWVNEQADSSRAMAMPTVETVETLGNIKEINSAVFIPPMAIISSLTSALSNAISLAIAGVYSLLLINRSTQRAGLVLKRLAVPLMVAAFSMLVWAMPSHVFMPNTALFDLENRLHQEVGVAGRVWSRLSNVQKLIL